MFHQTSRTIDEVSKGNCLDEPKTAIKLIKEFKKLKENISKHITEIQEDNNRCFRDVKESNEMMKITQDLKINSIK